MKYTESDFGRKVKLALIQKGYSLDVLAQMVSEKTGMYCDQPLLSRILTGHIRAESRPRIMEAVTEILDLT